jgi:hypothetical protein
MGPTIFFQRVFFSFLMFVLLLLTASEQGRCSTSPSPIGTVKEIRSGMLERQEKDLWKPMAAGMVIFANDRIRTDSDSRVVLTIKDIGAVLIGPGTEFYLGDPSRGFKTLLKRGYLWISAKLVPGMTMSVATSNAVAGVRGTKFSVIQDAHGTDVCTCKGAVQVALKDGKSIEVTSGMYGRITAQGAMDQPKKGKPQLEKIWKEKASRYTPCLNCHKKGRKIGDLN